MLVDCTFSGGGILISGSVNAKSFFSDSVISPTACLSLAFIFVCGRAGQIFQRSLEQYYSDV